MKPLFSRLVRRLKRVRSDAEQKVAERRNARQGNGFEYLAIHDGRTLNACVLAATGPSRLRLDGGASVPLPAPLTEGKNLVWVVDLLDLGLAPGTYRLSGIGDGGDAAPIALVPQSRSRADEPMLDGKVADLAGDFAEIVSVGSTAGILVTDGDPLPHLTSLNYYGPEAFRVQISSANGDQRIVATGRETGDTVVIGELSDGVGLVRVTDLEPQAPGHVTRWDVSLKDANGDTRSVYGPALDYNRPDKTTSYGDISQVESGMRRNWKPYISRAGVLAVQVSSEHRKNAS